MGIKIKGLKEVTDKIKRAVGTKLPYITAEVYLAEIKKNLEPSNKTGNLSKSWKITQNSFFKATISSNSPYAAIQNFGGRIKITPKMRSKMWQLFYSTGNKMYKNIAITKKPYVKIPAKKYLKISNSMFFKINIEFNKITNKI